MNTHRYTPQLIAEDKENLVFNIPLYQRLFAWGEGQVEGLLMDLKEHFHTSAPRTPYYLGMLSCIEHGNVYDLIDGQQRFTVVTLIAIVLRRYDERWKKFLDDGHRLRFVARPNDSDYLHAVIAGIDEHVLEPNKKMADAISTISQFMESKLNNEEERKSFAANTYERLSFFFSTLPHEYMDNPQSLNKYFEAMNSGGKGLEQHEILKVQLIRNRTQQEELTKIWNSVSDMSRPLIKKKENVMEDDYRNLYMEAINLCKEGRHDAASSLCESSFDSDDNIEIGLIEAEKPREDNRNRSEAASQSILTFPEFLMLVLDIHLKIGGSYTFYRMELLNAFKNYPLEDIHAFYNDLLLYRLLFDYFIITKEEDNNGNEYNLIMHQGSEFEIDCLCQYESMLYVSATPYYNWLKPLLIELASNTSLDAKDVLQILKQKDDALRSFPSSVEDLYYDCHPDRYWFWRLDYYLWEKKNDFFDTKDQEIVNDFVFRMNRSLEHLHPQHQDNNEEWDNRDVHSFGNLAMISQSFNSQQSDDPVTVKFARISDQANNHALQSIKLYLMYLSARKNPEGWTLDVMKEHEMQMFSLLQSTFPKE